MNKPQLSHEWIENNYNEWLQANSLFEEARDYIGLSKVGRCLVRQYNDFIYGAEPQSPQQAYRSRLGYEREWAIVERLRQMGIYESEPEIRIADGLVQGHPDGRIHGFLLEIKTVEYEDFLPQSMKLKRAHYMQAQAYMKYSGHKLTVFLYEARNSGQTVFRLVPYNAERGREVVQIVNTMVQAVRSKTPPQCYCRECRKER